jgi:phospholipid transport system transporter-binding protein
VSQARIVEQAPGAFQLGGVLDYLSGPSLREQGGRLIAASEARACAIDCAGVEKSSSVGLALLLAFMRDAQAAGKTLTVNNLPEDMRGIASVCELLELLPLES